MTRIRPTVRLAWGGLGEGDGAVGEPGAGAGDAAGNLSAFAERDVVGKLLVGIAARTDDRVGYAAGPDEGFRLFLGAQHHIH